MTPKKAKRRRQRCNGELIRDRRRIADMYLQGMLQAEIGEVLGLAQQTISRDLKALHKEWKDAALIDFHTAKAKELARIDRLEREYWRGWERSCEDAEVTVTKARELVGGGVSKEAAQTKKGQTGSPQFLAGVQWCIERRCKLLGLDKPQAVDLTSGGKPVSIREVVVNLASDTIPTTVEG